MEFQSPLPPVGETNLGLPQIRSKLSERSGNVRTIRANLDIVVGAGGRRNPRQQFQALLFAQPPDFLRVRGNQGGMQAFDILLEKNDVQVVIAPERAYYRGTLTELRANPEILAGVYPGELIDNFVVEQTLLKRLEAYPQALLYSTRDHYEIRFSYSDGSAERYQMRKRDLLVDRYQRFFGNRAVSEIRFWGYDIYDGRFLLPSQFAVDLGGGGAFLIRVTEMRVNEPSTPQIGQMLVPQGFEQRGFSQRPR
jgi:hypothetical protein